MTPDERRLIQDLFDRMRAMGRIDKDRDAEALIHQLVNAHPDSLYMMVQNVIVQEQALAQSEQRMQELEAEIQALRRPEPQQGAGGGGSFLGGLFGGQAGRAAPAASAGFGGQRGGAVPSYGAEAPRQSPWGSTGGSQSGGFQGTSTPQQPVPQQPARSGGGFLSGAMSTAAGVAGGMLAANAIGSMLGGGHGGGGLFGGGAASHQTQGNTPLPGPQQDHTQTASADDGLTEEDYDIDTADDGGGDVGGGDDSMDV